MYLQNNFLLDLDFHQIGKDAKKSGKYPKFMENIPNDIKNKDVISGCFERKHDYKFVIAVLQQGNIIVIQAEKRGFKNVIRLEVNTFMNQQFLNSIITNYVESYELHKGLFKVKSWQASPSQLFSIAFMLNIHKKQYIFTFSTKHMETTEQTNTETIQNTTPEIPTPVENPIIPTKRSHIKIIILISLGVTLILGVALFFFFKNQDRQNGYYGTYTLNFESKEVGTKTDEYVLSMGGDIPVSVGIKLKGIHSDNLTQVSYFYADPNNGKIYEERIFSGINNTQYFAIPRNGGEYAVGATLQYKDGTIIKSSDYFSAPLLTIWPDPSNDQIPIASLKTDRTSTSLQEEILFTVVTKIKAQDDSDFQKNKQVLRDFDGDGTRDRKSQGTTTRYRYTQSYGILQYEPKVAVVYKGFTGNTIGVPITIK